MPKQIENADPRAARDRLNPEPQILAKDGKRDDREDDDEERRRDDDDLNIVVAFSENSHTRSLIHPRGLVKQDRRTVVIPFGSLVADGSGLNEGA